MPDTFVGTYRDFAMTAYLKVARLLSNHNLVELAYLRDTVDSMIYKAAYKRVEQKMREG